MNLFLILFPCAVSAFQMTPTPGTKEYNWFREAEKKHARVALVAVPSLIAISAATGADPVPWLNAQPASTQLVFYSAAALLETLNLKRLDKGFTLKEDEVPGKLLWFQYESGSLPDVVEDAAGRVAMVTALAILVASSMN